MTEGRERRISTGINELDRVLGGGLVEGSVTLVGGDPGIGKSTLLIQAASHLSEKSGEVLYVSGEESPEQIKIRAERISIRSQKILLLSETNLEGILGTAADLKPKVIIIDSIQPCTPRSLPLRPDAAWRGTRISYLAGRSAYVEAGQAEGIAVGDTLFVLRGGTKVAALRAAFVSTHRASCDTLWTRVAMAIGDAVAYRPDLGRLRAVADSAAAVAAHSDSAREGALLAPPRDRAARRDPSFRGRIGARWLSVDSEGAGRTTQPALELRLDARDGFGGHTDLSLNVRGRRTLRVTDAGQALEQYSRIYRASVTLSDRGARRRLTFGRQSSPTLASVSVFDGALAEWNGSRHSLGGFAGTQPDPQRYQFSSEVFEVGGFAEGDSVGARSPEGGLWIHRNATVIDACGRCQATRRARGAPPVLVIDAAQVPC